MSRLQRPGAPALILASQSPSRRALMEAAGLAFEAHPAAVDEAALKEAAQAEGMPAGDAAILLAEAKAQRIARREPEALVIGADQMLVCEGSWYDKPPSLTAAREQLLQLRGRTHELVGGLVCWRHGQRVWQNVSVCRLTMREFSEEFLDAYLAEEGEKVLASVGAYRLEGPGMHLFSKVDGEHTAILGLPMPPLLAFLRQHGVLLS